MAFASRRPGHLRRVEPSRGSRRSGLGCLAPERGWRWRPPRFRPTRGAGDTIPEPSRLNRDPVPSSSWTRMRGKKSRVHPTISASSSPGRRVGEPDLRSKPLHRDAGLTMPASRWGLTMPPHDAASRCRVTMRRHDAASRCRRHDAGPGDGCAGLRPVQRECRARPSSGSAKPTNKPTNQPTSRPTNRSTSRSTSDRETESGWRPLRSAESPRSCRRPPRTRRRSNRPTPHWRGTRQATTPPRAVRAAPGAPAGSRSRVARSSESR